MEKEDFDCSHRRASSSHTVLKFTAGLFVICSVVTLGVLYVQMLKDVYAIKTSNSILSAEIDSLKDENADFKSEILRQKKKDGDDATVIARVSTN